jgi:alpha-beta hydrolase superfamily lysophospholipase
MAEMLATAAVFSGVGYLLTAYSISRWLTRPSRGPVRPTPAELGMECEEATCITADGQRLSGWVVAPQNCRGTVVLFHGMRRNRSQTLPRIALLKEAGYRCVAFDHRAHGKSTGRVSSFGYHESDDVQAVLDYVEQRWPDQPCAALGISMGAAAICFAAQRARRLNACILESLYYDVASAFDNRIGSRFPSWFRRFSGGVVWVTERRLRVRLHQITPADYIAQLAPTPLLLLTGTKDMHAPPSDSRRLYERCKGPRELAEIEGADHSNLWAKDTTLFRELVLGFLARHL